jgi:hypothetical protein
MESLKYGNFSSNGGSFSVNSQAGKEPKVNCISGNKQQEVRVRGY